MADPSPSPSSRQRLKKFFLEFGALGLAIHYCVYVLVLIGFVLSIQRHLPGSAISGGTISCSAVQGGAASASANAALQPGVGVFGVLAAAYVATKLTLPLRVLITVTLTPLLRALIRRLRMGRSSKPVANGPSS